jgi:enamine deaminase RidA (YjgF/YER057c/UK114 family)
VWIAFPVDKKIKNQLNKVEMSPEEKLKDLGITLPEAPKPLGFYIPAVRAGELLFLSGMLPLKEGNLLYKGKVGKDLSIEEAQEAAKASLINALSIIKEEIGKLNRVKRIVRLSGYVSSAPGFTQQPAVLNAASEILSKVFGEKGLHSRIAIGVSELPMGSPIEIELIVQVTL